MGTYLVMWETVPEKWPVDAKERAEVRALTRKIAKQDLTDGRTISWGAFLGLGKGYSLIQGNAPDVYKGLQRFLPYYAFNVQGVLSLDEVEKAVK